MVTGLSASTVHEVDKVDAVDVEDSKGPSATLRIHTRISQVVAKLEPLQLLFPHGSWSMRHDKSSWVMVHTSLYNALYDP